MSDLKAKLRKERQEKKVVIEAYELEKVKTRSLEGEVEKLRALIQSVEGEKRDKENKYLDLYMENT